MAIGQLVRERKHLLAMTALLAAATLFVSIATVHAATPKLKHPTAILMQATSTATPEAPTTRAPLLGSVQEVRALPPAMVGLWHVTATLLSTNMPRERTSPVVEDIWGLSVESLSRVREAAARDGGGLMSGLVSGPSEQVYITNPHTGARASVDVTEVINAPQGDTATFIHRQEAAGGRMMVIEKPTVTVQGDRLFGENIQTYLKQVDGRWVPQYIARFRIDAVRLPGTPTQ